MTAIPISKLTNKEDIPWNLLLLADPSEKLVRKYISISEVFIAEIAGATVGVIAVKIASRFAEIMNVAVKEIHQGNGIGSRLIKHAIHVCKASDIEHVRICTADTSEDQLRLYKGLGFKEVGRVKNYFLTNYDEAIYENGKQAKDMIQLEMSLP